MKKTVNITRAVLMAGVLALFAAATTGFAAEEGGGFCDKPKDSQCLANHPALGNWTPTVE